MDRPPRNNGYERWPQRGWARRRLVYTLTDDGVAALHCARGAWREFVRTLGSVLDAPPASGR